MTNEGAVLVSLEEEEEEETQPRKEGRNLPLVTIGFDYERYYHCRRRKKHPFFSRAL